jgi:hypothetical protein
MPIGASLSLAPRCPVRGASSVRRPDTVSRAQPAVPPRRVPRRLAAPRCRLSGRSELARRRCAHLRPNCSGLTAGQTVGCANPAPRRGCERSARSSCARSSPRPSQAEGALQPRPDPGAGSKPPATAVAAPHGVAPRCCGLAANVQLTRRQPEWSSTPCTGQVMTTLGCCSSAGRFLGTLNLGGVETPDEVSGRIQRALDRQPTS